MPHSITSTNHFRDPDTDEDLFTPERWHEILKETLEDCEPYGVVVYPDGTYSTYRITGGWRWPAPDGELIQGLLDGDTDLDAAGTAFIREQLDANGFSDLKVRTYYRHKHNDVPNPTAIALRGGGKVVGPTLYLFNLGDKDAEAFRNSGTPMKKPEGSQAKTFEGDCRPPTLSDRCAHCGETFGEHRTGDDACPDHDNGGYKHTLDDCGDWIDDHRFLPEEDEDVADIDEVCDHCKTRAAQHDEHGCSVFKGKGRYEHPAIEDGHYE